MAGVATAFRLTTSAPMSASRMVENGQAHRRVSTIARMPRRCKVMEPGLSSAFMVHVPCSQPASASPSLHSTSFVPLIKVRGQDRFEFRRRFPSFARRHARRPSRDMLCILSPLGFPSALRPNVRTFGRLGAGCSVIEPTRAAGLPIL